MVIWKQRPERAKKTALFLCLKVKEDSIMNRDVCSECGCSLRVTGSRNVVEGDDSKETPTRLFAVLTLECVNPKCIAYGVKSEIRNEQPLG